DRINHSEIGVEVDDAFLQSTVAFKFLAAEEMDYPENEPGSKPFIPKEISQKNATTNEEISDEKICLDNAQSFLLQGEFGLAVVHFNTALELNDKNPETFIGRGNAYYLQQKYQEAITDFTKAISLDPGLTLAYYN